MVATDPLHWLPEQEQDATAGDDHGDLRAPNEATCQRTSKDGHRITENSFSHEVRGQARLFQWQGGPHGKCTKRGYVHGAEGSWITSGPPPRQSRKEVLKRRDRTLSSCARRTPRNTKNHAAENMTLRRQWKARTPRRTRQGCRAPSCTTTTGKHRTSRTILLTRGILKSCRRKRFPI